MSSSSSYVTIPWCSVIFYGANSTQFVAFMRIHMRGFVYVCSFWYGPLFATYGSSCGSYLADATVSCCECSSGC